MSKNLKCPKCGTKMELSWYQPEHWKKYYFCPKCRDDIYDEQGKKVNLEAQKT